MSTGSRAETINREVYNAVLLNLSHDQEGNMEKLLRNIVEWESNHPPKTEYDGFAWSDVGGDPRTLNRLVVIPNQILYVVFKSNKYVNYRMIDVKAVEKALADYQGSFVQQESEDKKMPSDLFTLVIGHDDKKDILLRSLQAEKPVHGLLWGTVASAKTLILEDLSRLPQCRLLLGSNMTRAGLFDVLFNERPRYLIIDELDKVNDTEVFSALLSLMHKGFVSETKYRRNRTLRLKTWVFGSANDISKLPRELLSRFLALRFRDYSDDEFREVAVGVLRDQEGIPENLGVYIAEKVLKELVSRDTRDTVKIARLLRDHSRSEVDKVIEILRRQK